MPIPETPYTREEAYLNAIATGDSSGIPETPYTREEMYLDAIARNGGGGGGGGGSSTLAGMTDVDLTNPTDGQMLVYDAASSKWVNGSGGGGSSAMDVVIEASTLDLHDEPTWTLISGVYADVKSKLQSHLPVTGLVYSDVLSQQASILGGYLVPAGSNPEFILLYFLDEARGSSAALVWHSDGNIEYDS